MTSKTHSISIRALQILVVFILSALFSRATFANTEGFNPTTEARGYILANPESAR